MRSIICVILLSVIFLASAWRDDAVRLTNIKALTLHKGEWTKARRTSPIRQLECVGGSAQHSAYQPEVVQCINMGDDGTGQVQWECKADLDEAVKFGRVVVSCEGYSSPNDPDVLVGSCGLKYNLEYTRKGQKETNTYGARDTYPSNKQYYTNSPIEESSSGFGSVIMFIVIVGIVWMTLSACSRRANRNEFPQTFAPGAPGYGAAGYGAGYDNGYGAGYGGAGLGSGVGTGGGFWSGMATGGILSWLMRPRNSGYTNPGYQAGHNTGYNTGYSAPSSNYGGSSRGSGSGSGASRTASGFGGTERR